MMTTSLAGFCEDHLNMSSKDFSNMLDALKKDYQAHQPKPDDLDNIKDLLSLLVKFSK